MSTSKSKKKMPKLSVDEQMKKDLDNTKFLADWGFTGPNPNNCHRCGIHNSLIDGYMIQCAKCKLVYYCSMKCFNADLEAHRQFCDSGVLQSDVERVKLFDLPGSSVEDPISKEQTSSQQTKSPKSPKTPSLLGKTKSSLNTSPATKSDKSPKKPGKKTISPKKNGKVKATPKTPLKSKASGGTDSAGVSADTKHCGIPVPFAEDGTKVDSISSEGLLSPPVDESDTEPPKEADLIESTVGSMMSETSALPCGEEESPSLVVCVESASESLPYSPNEHNTELYEVNAPPEKETQPAPIEMQAAPLEIQPAPIEMQESPIEILQTPITATGLAAPRLDPSHADESEVLGPPKGEISLPSLADNDTREINLSASSRASVEPSLQAKVNDSPEPMDDAATDDDDDADDDDDDDDDDDKSSSSGAELSPLRSNRVWSEEEDEDVELDAGQAQLPRPPSLDLSSSSTSEASVVSEAKVGEESNQLPRTECELEGDGSESTIIEYEDVLIEVQTCCASGSADIPPDCHDGGDDSDFCALHTSKPLMTENTNEMADSHVEETTDESDGSNSTIVEYEEVIIEEEAYRASGSKRVDEESDHPDLLSVSEASKVCTTCTSFKSLEADSQSCEGPEPARRGPTYDDREVSRQDLLPASLPTETSTYETSGVDLSTGDLQTERPLKPLGGVATRGEDGEGSAFSGDDSTGSDTTIIEYEEVIIDEEWWGVSGNVNCFDGIEYELSEEVIRRKSGSVNVAGDQTTDPEDATRGNVRRFRLVGPTSSGRFFLRPVEKLSDMDEPDQWVDEEDGVQNASCAKAHVEKSDAHEVFDLGGRRGQISNDAREDQVIDSPRRLRLGGGSYIDEQKAFVPEVVDLKPVSTRSYPEHESNDSSERRIALRPTPSSPKQVPPERDPSFISKRSSLKEAPRAQPKSPSEMRDYSFIKKRSNLKETSPPPKRNVRSEGEHYLVFDKERKAYILRSRTGAKDAADARDVVVLRPVKPAPKRQFEFEKPEWVKKSPIRNRGSLEGLLGQSLGNLGHSIADLNNDEPPSPRTPSRHEDCDDDQSLGSFQELGVGPADAARSMDQSGETIHVLEVGTQEDVRRPRAGRAVAGTRHAAQSNVVLRSSPNSPGSKKVESKLPSWAIKSPLRTTERGLMMKSFSDLSKLGNASFSTMPNCEQAFAKPSRKSSAAYKYVSPHRYKGDYMNSMATMIEASYETNEGDVTDCKTLRSMPEL